MSDHSAATRRYASLTPGSSAASARRLHSSALALCSWALDGISSSDCISSSFPDRLNPLRADWFHSCDEDLSRNAYRGAVRPLRGSGPLQLQLRLLYSEHAATQL